MPYIAALFDEQQQTSMREAAHRIAAGSALAPQADPFHIQIHGGLHIYSDEAVAAAIAATPPLRGRFLKWEIAQQQLRAAVECDPAVLQHLHVALPQGKPWRTLYVRVGSVAGIDKAKHDEFLAAVVTAFPMDASLEFTTSLAFHNVPHEPVKLDAMQTVKTNSKTTKKPHQQTKAKKLNAKAIPFEPATRSVTIQKKQKKKQQKTSPHRKWERPSTGVTGRSAVDALIRSAAAAGSVVN